MALTKLLICPLLLPSSVSGREDCRLDYLEYGLLAIPWEDLGCYLVLLVAPELLALELNLSPVT